MDVLVFLLLTLARFFGPIAAGAILLLGETSFVSAEGAGVGSQSQPNTVLISQQQLKDAQNRLKENHIIGDAKLPGETVKVPEPTNQTSSPSITRQDKAVKPTQQSPDTNATRLDVAKKKKKAPKPIVDSGKSRQATSGQDRKQPVPTVIENSSKDELIKPCQLQPEAGPEMVLIADGQFLMGSPENEPNRSNDESPQHPVKILKPFAITRCEVSVAEFKRFVEATGYQTQAESSGKGCYVWDEKSKKWNQKSETSWRNPGFAQQDNHPVACISWVDAQQYLQWLNDILKLTQKPYRLPSEAEWEYAARGGTQEAFYWGQKNLCDYANNADKTLQKSTVGDSGSDTAACEDGYSQTAPVGSFKPNLWGLYDMAGNIWEWVEDCYHDSYQGAPNDGSVWQANQDECTKRSVRGGSWETAPEGLRTTIRNWSEPNAANNGHGFRLARTLEFKLSLLEGACGSKFYLNSLYQVWHKGPYSNEQSGKIKFTVINECSEGMCFEGTILFPAYNKNPDPISGYWKNSRIAFTRNVLAHGNSQEWEGTCRWGSVDGVWHYPSNEDDYGPFTISY